MPKTKTPKIGDKVKSVPKKERPHYVDNKKFYEALKEYKKECNKVEDKWNKKYGKEKAKLLEAGVKEKAIFKEKLLPAIPWPRVPDYIGECMFNIAHRLNNAPNFRNYTYRDDMIADGYEDCILRIRTFDPEKSTNPFSYFTQACYFASVRRIKKEKKQTTVKSEMIKNSGIIESMECNTMPGDDAHYQNTFLSFLQEQVDESSQDGKKDEGRKIVKKTTKAYQKKLKEQREAEERQKERDEFYNDGDSSEFEVLEDSENILPEDMYED